MCLAVPGQIIETRGNVALVDFQGNRMEVATIMTPEAGVDDWVLVHAGFAIACIDEAQAKETWAYLTEMGGEQVNDTVEGADSADG